MNEFYMNTRWFVYDYHCAAGRPKMEDAIFDFARKEFLYKEIYEPDLQSLVTICNRYQQKLWAENKRLKEVEITLTKQWGIDDNLRWLTIGGQSLHLRRIEGTISTEEFDSQYHLV
jgi:hypothetical protein